MFLLEHGPPAALAAGFGLTDRFAAREVECSHALLLLIHDVQRLRHPPRKDRPRRRAGLTRAPLRRGRTPAGVRRGDLPSHHQGRLADPRQGPHHTHPHPIPTPGSAGATQRTAGTKPTNAASAPTRPNRPSSPLPPDPPANAVLATETRSQSNLVRCQNGSYSSRPRYRLTSAPGRRGTAVGRPGCRPPRSDPGHW